MIERLVVFGAAGDLAGRYLLPGLAALRARGYLGDRFDVTCADRRDWDAARYRGWAHAELARFAAATPARTRAELVAAIRYQPADVTDAAAVARAVRGDGPAVVYLALPPALFPAAVIGAHQAGLPAGSRIVLEKPFGENLDDAVALNRLLAEHFPAESIFRVDHFLAMATVRNLLGTRLANRVVEPVWNSSHIAEVDIVWEETLALEGRAEYYDKVGALKDMLQNHLLQLLCLIAMEPPISLGENDLRNRKVDVLRSIRPLTDADIAVRTRRGRYTPGTIGATPVPGYVDEAGVDGERHTETFAEIELELDSWRWSGTVFRLRTGKALGNERKEIAVYFRTVPQLPFSRANDVRPNVLRFGLEPEELTLALTGLTAHGPALGPLLLSAELEESGLPVYGQLMRDVLEGNMALSIRGDEAELAWQVMTPILAGWSRNVVPLQEYPAGSAGPPERRADEPATGREPWMRPPASAARPR
jgi:glucose-6-phosphate 1-dehydrogenase